MAVACGTARRPALHPRQEPDYLLWLERTMVGRSLRPDIQRAMQGRPDALAATVVARPEPTRTLVPLIADV